MNKYYRWIFNYAFNLFLELNIIGPLRRQNSPKVSPFSTIDILMEYIRIHFLPICSPRISN